MMNDCGAFTCLLRFSNECRCSVRGCDVISCAYPVAAKNIKDSANIPAARFLIVAIAENAEVARTTAHRNARDLKPLDMEKLLKASGRLFFPVSIFTTTSLGSERVRGAKTQTHRISEPSRGAGDSLHRISMTAAEYEVLERQQYRLDAQQHRMHNADGVDCVKHKASEEADILRRQQVRDCLYRRWRCNCCRA